MGKEIPDILIKNCTLVNVYTRELIPDTDIAIKGKYIAFVGRWKYSESDVPLLIDSKNMYAIPGFIDGHTHFAYLMEPNEAIRYAIPTGTTSIVTELMEIYPLAGLEGMIHFMDLLKDQPIKFFFTVPAMVFTPTDRKGISVEDLERLLVLPEVVGMGESYWQGVLQEREIYLPNMLRTRVLNKTLEGHSAGAKSERLSAYVSAGIGSCHESTTSQEALERARLGLTVMIREGAVRKEMERIADLFGTQLDSRRFVLCSDGVDPEELMEKGYMDALVNKAISLGIEPLVAIQMVTINVAQHFRLEDRIGGIAPSRYGDILLSERLEHIRPRFVISSGRLVAEDGKALTTSISNLSVERFVVGPSNPRRFSLEDFTPKLPYGQKAKGSAIKMVTDLVTSMETLELEQKEGKLILEGVPGLNLVAAIERKADPNSYFVGLVLGYGLREGAFGCSAAWDTTDMLIVGKDPQDMAVAANRIFELKGGAAIVANGKILWELPMPLFGIMSDKKMPQLVEDFRRMRAILRELGVTFRDPLLSLVTLSTSAIPFFRICHEGYVDLKTGKRLGLMSP